MSLIIAEVKDGVVYMGADTRISWGDVQYCLTAESNLKIIKMPQGILLGTVGMVAVSQILNCHKDWFEEEAAQNLTKEYLVTQIVPKLYRELRKRGQLSKKEPAELECSCFLAQQDRLFRISHDFSVSVVPAFDAIGAGQNAAFAINELNSECSLKEKFLKGLRLAASCDNSIAAPFVFIDTKNLKFEIVEE